MRRASTWTIALLAAFLAVPTLVVAAAGADSSASLALEPYLLAWLFPLGVALVLVGISTGWSINDVAAMLPLALALAVVSELLCGFGLHYGGAVLGAEWEPVGPGWGCMGLQGFMLSDEVAAGEAAQALFTDLPLLTVALLMPLVVLRGRGPRWLRYAAALFIGLFLYPIAGNWVDGGGWLQQLDLTLGLGAGYADQGRLSLPLVATLASLGVSLALPRPELDESEPELRPAYLPLHVLLGGMLAWLGWQALTVPFAGLTQGLLVNLWAISGAVLFSALYGWLVRGSVEPGLIGRGLLAGLIEVGAAGAELSSLAAFVLGALAGLGLAPLIYLFDRSLRLQEQSGLYALFGALAVVSLLLPGLASSSNGLLVGAGAGQLYAQLLGLVALAIWGGVLPWALTVLGEYLTTLPAKLAARAERERLALEARKAQALAEAEQMALAGEVEVEIVELEIVKVDADSEPADEVDDEDEAALSDSED